MFTSILNLSDCSFCFWNEPILCLWFGFVLNWARPVKKKKVKREYEKERESRFGLNGLLTKSSEFM